MFGGRGGIQIRTHGHVDAQPWTLCHESGLDSLSSTSVINTALQHAILDRHVNLVSNSTSSFHWVTKVLGVYVIYLCSRYRSHFFSEMRIIELICENKIVDFRKSKAFSVAKPCISNQECFRDRTFKMAV